MVSETQPAEAPTPEQYLQRAADFMISQGITAVFVEGALPEDRSRSYEGISFMGLQGKVGQILFTEGRLVNADRDEIELRLSTRGFYRQVVRPVQSAAAKVYDEGSNILDDRFDVLPGYPS